MIHSNEFEEDLPLAMTSFAFEIEAKETSN